MSLTECSSYQSAVTVLRTHLDPGNKTLNALDFRHITQKETESVFDFIRWLERTFQIAFGHNPMSAETRDVLLYGKLQNGLHLDLVSKAPAISGAQSYQELCIAAKNEERWLAELSRRNSIPRSFQPYKSKPNQRLTFKNVGQKNKSTSQKQRCYICVSPGHLARDCRTSKSESRE